MRLIWTGQDEYKDRRLGQSVRGLQKGYKRPDVISITRDDILHFQIDMDYPTKLRCMDWFFSTVWPALDKDGTIIINFNGYALKYKPHES